MGVGSNLQSTIREWGVLVMFIVVISIVLLKFAQNSAVVCAEGYTYNTTEALCCTTGSTCAAGNASVNSLSGTINTFVSAFSEPQNWIGIVIIAIIGIALLALFNKLKSK